MILRTIFTILYVLLIITTVIMIIIDSGDSGKKFAWLLVIAFLPAVGLILYYMFGINYRHHWIFQRRHQRFTDAFNEGATEEIKNLLFGHEAEKMLRPEYIAMTRLVGQNSYPTLTDGNDIEIISWGHRKFELLCEDIKNAKESIHMEYFHFGNDDSSKCIKELLMAKAREGVKVRFIHENIANLPISSKYYENMRKAGVEVVKFTNPRQHALDMATRLNFRDHRKIVIIDGRIGYTGGMNINNHYFKEWRDTHMRITGKAVATLQYLFLDAWLTGGGAIDKPLIEFFPQAQMQEGSSKGIGPDFRQDDNMETADNRVTAENAAPALQDVQGLPYLAIQLRMVPAARQEVHLATDALLRAYGAGDARFEGSGPVRGGCAPDAAQKGRQYIHAPCQQGILLGSPRRRSQDIPEESIHPCQDFRLR